MTTKVSTNMLNQTGNLDITAANVSLGPIANIHITGGTSGQAITTDGAGNLSFSAVTTTPAGSNTQIQFNDAGSYGANAGLTFNKTTTTLTANNFVASATANLGAVGNVIITGGTSGQVLTTDGAGNLSFATASAGGGSNAYITGYSLVFGG
jgi:hypothetical protein